MKNQTNTLISREVGLELRNADVESRTAEFVISTEEIDTYGTVFKAAGAVTDRYLKNPIVTYQHLDHSSDPDDVIGTSEIRMEDGQWVAKATFEDGDTNPKADKVLRKIANGTLRMASIMAQPLEGSYGASDQGEDPEVFYFRKWELYSWSVVTHGSNPAALKRNAQNIEDFKTAHTEEEEKSDQDNPRVRHSAKARILQLKSI